MLYGPWPDNPNFLTEGHPLRGHPHAHSVQDRVEMEGLVADWARRHPDVTVTVLRPCWIFGPSYMDAAVRYFARPVVPVPMGCDPLIQLVHEEDVVAAFEQAAREMEPAVRFLKLNSDEEQQVSGRLGIRGIPTLLMFSGGREIARQSGAMSASQITGWIRQHLR